jgi:excisionase family DNA binding protein
MHNPFELIETRLEKIENLLLDLKASQPIPPEPDKWYDITELCNYLPDKPTRATVYGWVHFSLIPNHKTGKKLRFLQSEIDTWLKTGRRKTAAEIQAESDSYCNKKGGEARKTWNQKKY